jgi:hypothetical protein
MFATIFATMTCCNKSLQRRMATGGGGEGEREMGFGVVVEEDRSKRLQDCHCTFLNLYPRMLLTLSSPSSSAAAAAAATNMNNNLC